MEPQRDPRGKPTLDRVRHPAAVDIPIDHETIVVDRPPVDGPPAQPDTDRRLSRPDPRPGSSGKLSRRREKLTQIALALRAEGWSVGDIADRLGVTPGTITGWFTQHRRAVTLDEIDVMLDRIAIPLATENLIHGLLAGDKDYTLETLKGRGAFKRHAEGEGKTSTELPALQIIFESPTPAGPLPIGHTGKVLGALAIPKLETLDATPVHTETHSDAATALPPSIACFPEPAAAPRRGGDVSARGLRGDGPTHPSRFAAGPADWQAWSDDDGTEDDDS